MKLGLSAGLLAALGACQSDETLRAYGGADHRWVLTELNGKPFTARATLTFPDGVRMSGDAPCNSYSATMTVPYPWFEAGPIAATKRACADLPSEAAFFAALSAATLSEVSGPTLILSNDDTLLMVFKAAD